MGAQGARQLRPLPATDPAIGQADARAPHGGGGQRPSPVCPYPVSSPHRCFHRWVRPQPELCPQLVYLWGATVVCGSWQGTPGGFSRGLAEVPLSALLPPTSWARKKSARLPGRVPAISAAEGGTFGAPRRGAKKAVRPQGGKPKPARGGTRSCFLPLGKRQFPSKHRRVQRGNSKTAGAGPGNLCRRRRLPFKAPQRGA